MPAIHLSCSCAIPRIPISLVPVQLLSSSGVRGSGHSCSSSIICSINTRLLHPHIIKFKTAYRPMSYHFCHPVFAFNLPVLSS
ncbi:hypothetical protein CRENBAI_005633 [Crenichthys baileyi]|uniref:Uncharacterized protein n=1 Tax=Crenichthys baileyi TaxID=28760 RepID=A0AAV9R679_9TELE